MNWFIKVYVEFFFEDDFLEVVSILYFFFLRLILKNMVEFNFWLYYDIMVFYKYGYFGFFWEFNFRDVLRWCEFMENFKVELLDGDLYIGVLDYFFDVMYF